MKVTTEEYLQFAAYNIAEQAVLLSKNGMPTENILKGAATSLSKMFDTVISGNRIALDGDEILLSEDEIEMRRDYLNTLTVEDDCKKFKVVAIDTKHITFEMINSSKKMNIFSSSKMVHFKKRIVLTSSHPQEYNEKHYLCFEDLKLKFFEKLEFTLEAHFFDRVPGYGIFLKPINGHPIPVPGYGYNNGQSKLLNLKLKREDTGEELIKFNITECQNIEKAPSA